VSVKVNSQPYVPSSSQTTTETITLNSNQKITKIVANTKNTGSGGSKVELISLVLTFTNPGTTQATFIGGTANPTHTYTFDTPAGQEFVGFSACHTSGDAGEI